jgi:hypothetical protein
MHAQIHLYSDGGLDISKDGKHLVTCAQVFLPPGSPPLTAVTAAAATAGESRSAFTSRNGASQNLVAAASASASAASAPVPVPVPAPPVSWDADRSTSTSTGSPALARPFPVPLTTDAGGGGASKMASSEQSVRLADMLASSSSSSGNSNNTSSSSSPMVVGGTGQSESRGQATLPTLMNNISIQEGSTSTAVGGVGGVGGSAGHNNSISSAIYSAGPISYTGTFESESCVPRVVDMIRRAKAAPNSSTPHAKGDRFCDTPVSSDSNSPGFGCISSAFSSTGSYSSGKNSNNPEWATIRALTGTHWDRPIPVPVQVPMKVREAAAPATAAGTGKQGQGREHGADLLEVAAEVYAINRAHVSAYGLEAGCRQLPQAVQSRPRFILAERRKGKPHDDYRDPALCTYLPVLLLGELFWFWFCFAFVKVALLMVAAVNHAPVVVCCCMQAGHRKTMYVSLHSILAPKVTFCPRR